MSLSAEGTPARIPPSLVALAGIAVAFVALAGVNRETVGLFHDDGIYTVVAKSLSEGEGYRIVSLPSSPHQTKYPFLYSYLLSWIWQINPNFPDNVFFLKALNVAFLFGIFVVGYCFYCQNTWRPGLEAVFYSALVCTNRAMFSLTDFTLSDLLFVLLTISGLVLCHGTSRPSSGRGVAILSSVIGLACITKPAGAPLLFAGVFFFLANRRYKDLALYLLLTGTLVLPWLLWVAANAPGRPNGLLAYYMSHEFRLSDSHLIDLFTGNLHYMYDSINLIFSSSLIPGLAVVICVVTAVGLADSLRKHNCFFWCFLSSYFLLVLAWPFHPLRYTLPLIPVIMLFLFRGSGRLKVSLDRALKTGNVRIGRVTVHAFVTSLVVLNLFWLSNYLLYSNEESIRGPFGWRFAYGWNGFLETFEWIRRNTNESDIVATGYDPMYYHYTGRKAVRPGFHKPETYFYPYGKPTPDIGTAQQIRNELALLKVRYLIVDPLDGYAEGDAQSRIFAELLESYPTPPELVFTSSDEEHIIYKLPLGDVP